MTRRSMGVRIQSCPDTEDLHGVSYCADQASGRVSKTGDEATEWGNAEAGTPLQPLRVARCVS